jgi:hypothetical protein
MIGEAVGFAAIQLKNHSSGLRCRPRGRDTSHELRPRPPRAGFTRGYMTAPLCGQASFIHAHPAASLRVLCASVVNCLWSFPRSGVLRRLRRRRDLRPRLLLAACVDQRVMATAVLPASPALNLSAVGGTETRPGGHGQECARGESVGADSSAVGGRRVAPTPRPRARPRAGRGGSAWQPRSTPNRDPLRVGVRCLCQCVRRCVLVAARTCLRGGRSHSAHRPKSTTSWARTRKPSGTLASTPPRQPGTSKTRSQSSQRKWW